MTMASGMNTSSKMQAKVRVPSSAVKCADWRNEKPSMPQSISAITDPVDERKFVIDHNCYWQTTGELLMQFNRLQAYLENDRVVVLAPDQAPHFFQLQAESGRLFGAAEDSELARRALAYATWGPLTIRNNAYRDR